MSTFDRSLRSGFLRQVALRPDGLALVVKDRTLSYGELDATARRRARWEAGRVAGHQRHRLGPPDLAAR